MREKGGREREGWARGRKVGVREKSGREREKDEREREKVDKGENGSMKERAMTLPYNMHVTL